MTTSAPTRPDAASRSRRSRPVPESVEAKAARLRLRRRLVLWSLPVVLVLGLIALKLLVTVSLGDQARAAYAAGDITGTQEAADRLGWLNWVERHKAPFALGDARALAGDNEGARQAFEEALGLAPPTGEEACQIRVNLVLTLEKLSQAATAAGRTAESKADDARIADLVNGAPPACFDGGGDTGQQLGDAQQRAQDRQQAQADRQQNQSQAPQPDQPSQDKQQLLDDMTKDNLLQRQDGDEQRGSYGRPLVDKPW